MIDWDVDPEELIHHQSDGAPDFRVVWSVDGTDSHWADAEPNQIILNYLHEQAKRNTEARDHNAMHAEPPTTRVVNGKITPAVR